MRINKIFLKKFFSDFDSMNNLTNFNLDDSDLEFDLDFDFDLDAFSIGDEVGSNEIVEAEPENITRFARVKRFRRPRVVTYEYAEKMAGEIGLLEEGDCVFAIISGNFIAGDLIEAYLVENNLFAEEIIIATLSMSKENVDSLKNLRAGGYVDKMALIVSDYFYAHERINITEYLIHELGCDEFSFAAAGIHTKIAMMKTSCGRHLVLSGSANLRSSRNVEQLVFENSKTIYDFNRAWMYDILMNYQVKHERLRGDKLWRFMVQN